MKRKSEIVFKTHLDRCTPEIRSALLRFLPESEQNALAELPDTQKTNLFTSPSAAFDKVHWSWFLPTIKTFSEREQRLFLSALEPHAAEQLKASLSLSGPPEEITETAKGFLRQELLHTLISTHDGILPAEYLPPSPFNQLLALNKKELIRLIDSLALYDLAQEVRQIVETKILKKIYSLLSEQQKTLLQQITIPKELNLLPRLGIEKWEGTEELLRLILHRRGITRLGIALSGQDPDLIWMVCHQLDVGRGGTLLKLCEKEKRVPLADTIQRQIEELLGLL